MRQPILLIILLFTQATAFAADSFVILQYHHVAEDTPAVTSIRPLQFRAHLQHLKDEGFNIIDLKRGIKAVLAEEPLPDKAVAITFDDAYRNILTNAAPILDEFGYTATIFVATDLVGTSQYYMSWEELRCLESRGYLMANHSASHAHLLRITGESGTEWRENLVSEIESAQDKLEQELENPVRYFAYPYGEYNDMIMRLMIELGYMGFGQQSGAVSRHSNFLALPRYALGGHYVGLDAFADKANSKPMPLSSTTPVTPVVKTGQTRAELTLNFLPGDWRIDALNCFGPVGKPTVTSIDDSTVKVSGEITVGRSRFNCTMPSAEPGRFHWFSKVWIRKRDDGSWYPEP